MHAMGQAQQVVRSLFVAYLASPQEMAESFTTRSKVAGDAPNAVNAGARVVADYIAGMTDRFAVREHERLMGLKPLSAIAGLE